MNSSTFGVGLSLFNLSWTFILFQMRVASKSRLTLNPIDRCPFGHLMKFTQMGIFYFPKLKKEKTCTKVKIARELSFWNCLGSNIWKLRVVSRNCGVMWKEGNPYFSVLSVKLTVRRYHIFFVEINRLLFFSSFQRKVNIFLQCLLIFCFCNSKSGDQRKRGQNGKSGISRIS